jgi:hypothetical protein
MSRGGGGGGLQGPPPQPGKFGWLFGVNYCVVWREGEIPSRHSTQAKLNVVCVQKR